jgi:alpha-glutamyl/putrescinyl thymine pyrophosphorylase clade 1
VGLGSTLNQRRAQPRCPKTGLPDASGGMLTFRTHSRKAESGAWRGPHQRHQPIPMALGIRSRPESPFDNGPREPLTPPRPVACPPVRATPGVITVAGRRLRPTPVFDTYWRFAARRQKLYYSRINGEAPPWTDDAVLREYRFTNAFRASDRVSQFLIRHVMYADNAPCEPDEIVFRTLLFKMFNKVSTWNHLEKQLGQVRWADYDFDRYRQALDQAAASGPIYSAAYVIPPPRLGESKKHMNHLRLLERIMRDRLGDAVAGTNSLADVYDRLVSYPSIGNFLAFQFTIDLNYSTLLSGDENDFVVAGPGAQDGIRKCFGPESRGIESEIIRYVTDSQELHVERLSLDFGGLFGRRLHLIDCQNLFCEVDKYARVAHPEVTGVSGRRRIKQRFRPNYERIEPFFPPKWQLKVGPPASEPAPSYQGR